MLCHTACPQGDSPSTSIQLDFGDGIKITYSNLSRTDDGIKHIYRMTGIYRVTASAENSQGSDSSTLFLHITSMWRSNIITHSWSSAYSMNLFFFFIDIHVSTLLNLMSIIVLFVWISFLETAKNTWSCTDSVHLWMCVYVCVDALGPVEHVYFSIPIVAIRGKAANLTAVVWPSHTRTLTFFWWFDNSSEVRSLSSSFFYCCLHNTHLLSCLQSLLSLCHSSHVLVPLF